MLLHILISLILMFFGSHIWFIIFILWFIWNKINILFLFIWWWLYGLFCLFFYFCLHFWSDHFTTAWMLRGIRTIFEWVINRFKTIIVGYDIILFIVIIVLLNQINIFNTRVLLLFLLFRYFSRLYFLIT